MCIRDRDTSASGYCCMYCNAGSEAVNKSVYEMRDVIIRIFRYGIKFLSQISSLKSFLPSLLTLILQDLFLSRLHTQEFCGLFPVRFRRHDLPDHRHFALDLIDHLLKKFIPWTLQDFGRTIIPRISQPVYPVF